MSARYRHDWGAIGVGFLLAKRNTNGEEES